MAGHGVTDVAATAHLPTEAAQVIDAYLCTFTANLRTAGRMPTDVLDELRADLFEATLARLTRGSDPVRAARAAVADFGDAATVATAFRPELATRHSRRLGLTLLVTGPLVGLCWLAAGLVTYLHAPPAWRWLPLLLLPVLTLGAPATAITVASTGRWGTRWFHWATALPSGAVMVAAAAAGAGDLLLLTWGASLAMMVGASSPLALALCASTARLALLVRTGWHWFAARRGVAASGLPA